MKKLIITISAVFLAIIALLILKSNTGASVWIWNLSSQGTWLLPLVIFSSLLDSVHPCSFSVLLITIAFMFGMQMSRKKILTAGGVYIAGIFSAYFLIGLGLLKVLHFFNIPHFMGKFGAVLLVLFGLINVINHYFPKFPIKLKLPSAAHSWMSDLIDKASIPAAFGLGILVGICQFPCMGGPYLMVIGLLHDQVTYLKGFVYLLLYNLILILPLIAVLVIASSKALLEKVEKWKKEQVKGLHLVVGIVMVAIGLVILLLL